MATVRVTKGVKRGGMGAKTTARKPNRTKIMPTPPRPSAEAHEGHHESSSDSGTNQDNDDTDWKSHGDDNRQDVASKSVEAEDMNGKEQHSLRPSEVDVDMDMDMDRLERSSCILCKRDGDGLLVCTENGCPICIHEACMVSKPAIDDIGNFYCPYCWYKRELSRAEQIKKKMMLAKKDLSNFMCPSQLVGENEEKQKDSREKEKSPNRCADAGKKSCYHSAERPNDHVQSFNKDRSNRENNHEAHKYTECMNEDERGEYNRNSRHHGMIEQQQLKDPPSNYCLEKNIATDSLHLLCDAALVLPENRVRIKEQEPTHHSKTTTSTVYRIEGDSIHGVSLGDTLEHEPFGTDADTLLLSQRLGNERTTSLHGKDLTGKVSTNDCMDSCDCDHLTLALRLKHLKPITKAACSKIRPPGLNNEVNVMCHKPVKLTVLPPVNEDDAQKVPLNDTMELESSDSIVSSDTTKVVSCEKHIKKEYARTVDSPKRGPIFGNVKRARLHWRPEEEEKLKEGMRKFSSTINKKIPWRKILEFGSRVFDNTRTPADLKGKWKNILAKKRLIEYGDSCM